MGNVKCLTLSTFKLIFYSNDHRPAHFHVICEKWEIRVFIETTTPQSLHYDIKWSRLKSRNPSRKTLKTIAEGVCKHRKALLKEWASKVHGKGS